MIFIKKSLKLALSVLRAIKDKIRSYLLRGSNVVCPICKKSFITFLPFGVAPSPKRANAQCPACYSLERTRLYWLYLNSVGGFFDSTRNVLHVAPEQGLFKIFKKNKNFNYYPIDRFEMGYSYPKGTINMDITSLDFPENFFDFILCSHVLEHVTNDYSAMKEFHRVLRKDGFGILQVPIDNAREVTYEDSAIISPEERVKAFGQFDHVRVYGKDYKNRLEQAGFIVEIQDYVSKLTEADRFKYGLAKGELLYIVRK